MKLDFTIVRSSRRRKLTITVERDRSIVVHAPEGASDETIRRVVESERQWIHEKTGHPQKYRDLPHPPGKEVVSGESALYLGRQYRIEVVETDASEVRFNRCFLVPAIPGAERATALRAWYMGRAKEKIIPRVRLQTRLLGVEVGRVRIVDSRYRWGSCTLCNNVNFTWRLIKAPMFVIDYVIVHELAHLIESNHTPRFWNIVRAQAPTTEKAKAWLREHGQLLEQAI
jgi:predicted metal-dependent hydrolase